MEETPTQQLKPAALLCPAPCREVVAAHPDHLEAALKTVIHNELGAARNPGNMQLMVILISSHKDLAAKVTPPLPLPPPTALPSPHTPLNCGTTTAYPCLAPRLWLMCSWVSCGSARTPSDLCAAS